jgi:multidrug transporter EmrE-like cation transporter
MNIITLIIIAIIFRMGFDIFVSRAGGRINDYVANGIFSVLAGVLPLLIYAFSRSQQGTQTTKAGVIYSILAGVSVGVFSIALVKIFSHGGNLSMVSPAIYGGTIVGVSLVGWLVFKEPFSLLGAAGVATIAAGIGMVVAARA